MPWFFAISFSRNYREADIIQIETKNILKSGYFLRPFFPFMRMMNTDYTARLLTLLRFI